MFFQRVYGMGGHPLSFVSNHRKIKNIKFICLLAPQMRICKDSTKQIKEQKVFF
jgi:hypothetical protein